MQPFICYFLLDQKLAKRSSPMQEVADKLPLKLEHQKPPLGRIKLVFYLSLTVTFLLAIFTEGIFLVFRQCGQVAEWVQNYSPKQMP